MITKITTHVLCILFLKNQWIDKHQAYLYKISYYFIHEKYMRFKDKKVYNNFYSAVKHG